MCYRVRWIIATQLVLTPVVALPFDLVIFAHVRGQTLLSVLSTLFVPPMFLLLLYGLAVAQGQRRYRSVQLHRLVQPVLYVAMLLALAATDNGRLKTLTVGWSFTMMIGGLFAWRQGVGAWWPRPQRTLVENASPSTAPGAMMRFSLRSLFSAFGIIEHLQADQLLVGALLSASQFGLYTAGTAFANLPRYLGQSVGYVAYPEVSAAAHEHRRKTMLRFVMIGLLVITPIVVILVAIMANLLPLLLGSAFRPAVPVAQILLVGALIQAMRRVTAESLRGLGSGVSATAAELVFIAVFATALVPLTDAHHAIGAAVASVLASGAAALTLLVTTLLSSTPREEPAPAGQIAVVAAVTGNAPPGAV